MKKTLLASAVLLAVLSTGANAYEHIHDSQALKPRQHTMTNPYVFAGEDDSYVVKVANGLAIDAQLQSVTLGIGTKDKLLGKIEVVGKNALVLGNGDGAMYADSIHLEATKGQALQLYRHLELTGNSVTIKATGNAVQFRGSSGGLTINGGDG